MNSPVFIGFSKGKNYKLKLCSVHLVILVLQSSIVRVVLLPLRSAIPLLKVLRITAIYFILSESLFCVCFYVAYTKKT